MNASQVLGKVTFPGLGLQSQAASGRGKGSRRTATAREWSRQTGCEDSATDLRETSASWKPMSPVQLPIV